MDNYQQIKILSPGGPSQPGSGIYGSDKHTDTTRDRIVNNLFCKTFSLQRKNISRGMCNLNYYCNNI